MIILEEIVLQGKEMGDIFCKVSLQLRVGRIMKESAGRIGEAEEEYYKNHKEVLHSLKIQLKSNSTKGVHNTRK